MFFCLFPLLQKFSPLVEINFLKSELLPAFITLTRDEQDSVRVLTVKTCVDLAKIISVRDTV